MPRKITEQIQAVCKENEIKYTSRQEAKRLGELITDLNVIVDEIYCILDRNEIKTDFKKEIERDLTRIHAIDHDLIKLAKELLNEKK